MPPVTHSTIDDRLLRLVLACLLKVDANHALLSRAHAAVQRQPNPCIRTEWKSLLALPWPELSALLLETSDRGQRLRQDAPFGGLLSPEERMTVFRRDTPAA